jgi:predicted signal transduction protein with EAL and GGDEF domain/ABC-type amino acid transport substrate-binding protein
VRSIGLGVFVILVCVWNANFATAADAFVPPANIVFGGDSTFAPMEWQDGDEPRGFNIDVAQAIAKVGGTNATYHLGAWPDVLRGLQDGSIDAASMYRSPEREKYLLLTDNYYYVYHAIYSLRGVATATTPAGLIGKRVATEEGSFAHAQLSAQVPAAIVVPTQNTLSALQRVVEGKADYAVITALSAERLIQQNNLPLQQHGAPFWPASLVFAVHKDRPELAAWLRASLIQANSSGELSEIFQKWKPELVPREYSKHLMRMLFATAGMLFASLLLGSVWYWSMKRQVTVRTHELSATLKLKQQAETELTLLASTDPATGLSRPAHFIAQVDACLEKMTTSDHREAELLVVRLIDLNNIVRSFGFERASDIVRSFAGIVLSFKPRASAHLGRGVFAMLLDGRAGAETVHELMRQLKNAYAEFPARLVGGSARWPVHGDDADQLMRHAETALAVSAQNKHAWKLYSAEMEPSVRDLDIVNAFIEGDVKGLYPVFQPRLNLVSGTCDGAETLARWNHPLHGEIPPSVFVPILESAGLIGKLTDVMVGHALRVGQLLSVLGFERIISVNVAAHDLMDSGLVDDILNASKRYGNRCDLLQIELTETSVASDPERAKQTLEQLQAHGISVSLDDFGTGYSSLSYLSLFPIREIKIDKSFVTDMLNNARHRSIVRSTFAMARALGMATVAEGIEDQATLSALLEDGCTSGQGFHICYPLTEADFIHWLGNTQGAATKMSVKGNE